MEELLSDNGGNSLGETYVEIGIKTDKLTQDLTKLESDVKVRAERMIGNFQAASIRFNDSLAKKSISEIETSVVKLRAQLERKIEMNAPLGQLEALKSSLNKAEQAVATFKQKAAEPEQGGFLSKLFGSGVSEGIGGFMTKMVGIAAATFTVQKGFQFITESVDAFDAREKAMLGVDSIIHSMGKEAEYSADGILKLAKNVADFNKNSVKVNDVLDLEGYLMTLDSMNKEKLPRATQLVVDLAAKMKTDLVGAGKAVGIVSEDVEGGLNRFRRAGIVFSDTQKEQIKNLVDQGDKAGALAKVFELLEAKVGGYARNTTTAFEEMKNKASVVFGAIERSIGGVILKALTPFGTALVGLASAFKPYESALGDVEKKSLEARTHFDILATTIERLGRQQNKTNEETQIYQGALKEMDDNFGTHLEKLSTEKDAWNKIAAAINDTSKALYEKARADAIVATTADWQKEATDRMKTMLGHENDLSKAQLREKQLRDKGYASYDINTSQAQQLGVATLNTLAAQSSIDADKQYILERGQWIQAIKTQNAELFQSTNPSPGNPNTGVKPSKDQIKSELESKYALMESVAALDRQSIKDKHERAMQEAVDTYNIGMTKLKDEENAGNLSVLQQKSINEQKETLMNNLATAYDKEMDEKNVDDAKKAQELLDQKLAFEKSYNSQMMSLEKDRVDQQIKDYTLTVSEFKAHLDKMLALKIKGMEEENEKIKENNKKFNLNNPTINIDEQKGLGAKENKSQTDDYQAKQTKKELDDWKKKHEIMANVSKAFAGQLVTTMSDAFTQILTGQENLGEGLTNMWRSLSAEIISIISQILVKYALLAAAKAIFGGATGGFGGFIIDALGGHSGGNFVGTDNGVMKMSTGGSFIVPPGHTNDSFPLMVESGEHVSVTPANQVSKGNDNVAASNAAIASKIDGLNMNLVNLLSRDNSPKGVVVNVDGKTLAKVLIKNENKIRNTGYNFNEYND
jgi:hypothetical protein